MTRLMLMTFFTDKRWAEGVHPHESPKVMTVPLIVLAALSVFGGVMLIGNWIVDFLEPVTGTVPDESPPIPSLAVSVIVVVIVAVGVAAAWFFVGKQRGAARGAAGRLVAGPCRSRRALWQRDQRRSGRHARARTCVTGLTLFDRRRRRRRRRGGALGAVGTGLVLRLTQTGFVRSYALSLLAGAVLVVVALLAVNLA